MALSEESFLRLPQVRARVGLGRSEIYEQMAEGRFPHHVPIGKRSVAWLSSEISAWIEARIRDARGAR